MHEVDTAVWQKKPPLHAHRPATTCEVTCEGAIENPTASERSAKSRSLTRTKFEIAKKKLSSQFKTQKAVESVQNSERRNCVESHQNSERRNCVESHQNSERRNCVESHQNSERRNCVESHQNSERRNCVESHQNSERRNCVESHQNSERRNCVEFTSKLNDEKLPDPVKCELKKV